MASGPGTAWTRVNIAEGQPGVQTPLSWTLWEDACERMIRATYRDAGVTPLARPVPRSDIGRRSVAVFHGRPALNVDVSREGADLMPFFSGDDLERHYFGAVRGDATSAPSKRLYPLILGKGAVQFFLLPGWLRKEEAETARFWRRETAPAALDDAAGAPRRFAQALVRFDEVSRRHSLAAFYCVPLISAITNLALAVERPDLILRLAGGGSESHEVETAADLWKVSRGRLTMDEFLRRHGFQGSMQGELSSFMWREDPSPVERLVGTYRRMPDGADPDHLDRERRRDREDAERRLLAALPKAKRAGARTVLSGARTYLPLRNVGKNGLAMAFDVARAAARTTGNDLAARGVLADPGDVFYLTLEEFGAELPENVQELVAFRRATRAKYLALELPESWIGQPEPVAADAAVVGDGAVSGLGASSGVVEGRVRVLADPLADDLEPGEILVCRTTDPSYASYFLVAAGCVIDVGGALSHGAIAAREMGIPCVINTRDGTKKLHTGDLVRIDGDVGTVEVLETAGR